ncbi:MAG: cysteine synthase family protein [Bacilli bacterium]|nr:cysteine synthase family protein [Bacilli bacterium]
MVGSTKLVKLDKILKKYNCINNIYAKVEATNPSGSIKDRACFYMLSKDKELGLLKDGGTVVEATSGNMGISLAFFQKELNYKAIIVMPSSMSVERRAMIQKYGATLELVDGGMQQCKQRASEIVASTKNAIMFRQFEDKNNALAHFYTTAPEIDKEAKADYIFAGIGTGGTISGIGKYYKDNKLDTKIVGIEPNESPLITKGEAHPHLIQGIGANFIPDILDLKVVDEVTLVKGEEAIKMAKMIRDLEGIDCGYSSGAALAGAISYLNNLGIKNKNVVVIFPDRGDRYSW